MNRRDAVKALMGLPALASVSVASLKPEDVIVAECDRPLCQQEVANIQEMLSQIWPNHRVAIVDSSIKLKVMRAADR